MQFAINSAAGADVATIHELYMSNHTTTKTTKNDYLRLLKFLVPIRRFGVSAHLQGLQTSGRVILTCVY